jgi:hypothetical protein
MSIMKNFAPGVEITLLMSNLTVNRPAVGTPALNGQCTLSPSATNLVLLGSYILLALIEQVMRPYVTSFALGLGTLSLWIKKIVFVPFTQPDIPCTSCPSVLGSPCLVFAFKSV